MKNFTKNSSYKVIRLTDNPNLEVTFSTYYSFEKRNFDMINLEDDSELVDIMLNNNEIDAIIVQYDNEIDLPILNSLPEYIKRRTYIYNNESSNYGIDLALRISKDQLSKYSTPMFSIVTPLYNTNLEYFKRAYQSMYNQTLNDWEWILVDDSPEELNDIKEFIKETKDIRLKYYRIDPTNGNIGLAKWRANCMSTGKWLLEFDHDDYLFYWALQTLKEGIEKFPDNKFIYTDNSTIDRNDNITECLYGKDYTWGLGYGHSYMTKSPDGKLYRTDSAGPINNSTIRHIVGVPNHIRCWERNFYFAIGGHNITQRIADDYELLLRSFLNTKFTHVICSCYAQRFDGNNSQYQKNQDSDGQGNIADIQRRLRLATIYYDKAIHDRLEEVGLKDDKWIVGDPYETAKLYEKIHPTEFYEDQYFPKWLS